MSSSPAGLPLQDVQLICCPGFNIRSKKCFLDPRKIYLSFFFSRIFHSVNNLNCFDRWVSTFCMWVVFYLFCSTDSAQFGWNWFASVREKQDRRGISLFFFLSSSSHGAYVFVCLFPFCLSSFHAVDKSLRRFLPCIRRKHKANLLFTETAWRPHFRVAVVSHVTKPTAAAAWSRKTELRPLRVFACFKRITSMPKNLFWGACR